MTGDLLCTVVTVHCQTDPAVVVAAFLPDQAACASALSGGEREECPVFLSPDWANLGKMIPDHFDSVDHRFGVELHSCEFSFCNIERDSWRSPQAVKIPSIVRPAGGRNCPMIFGNAEI